MEGAVSWVALVAGLNLAINSVTLLFVVAQSLRLTSFLTTAEFRDTLRGHRNRAE